MKSIINSLIRELPDNVETVAFPRQAYLELVSEIDAIRNQLAHADEVIKVADPAIAQAADQIEKQNARIAQLTQWLESAEAACMEKDAEIARLKRPNQPVANNRADNARAQRMAAMGVKTEYAVDKKGNKVAAVEVPVPADERIKALCAELTQMKAAVDQEHDRYLAARREIARLNERLQAANSDMLDTKTDLLAAQQGLIDLNHAYEQLRTTAEQLVKQKAELEEQLKKSKSANRVLTTERDSLRQAAAHPARVDQMEAEIAFLKQENARMTIQLDNACKEISGRQTTIERLQKRNVELRTAQNDICNSTRAEVDRLRAELIKARQDRDYWLSVVRNIYNTASAVAEHA